MKKIIGVLSIAALMSACNVNKKHSDFEIKGTLTNSNGETIYLEALAGNKPIVVDSAKLNEKGEFEMNSYSPAPGFYRIKLSESNFGMLVTDSTEKITINGDAKDLGHHYEVEGSPDTKLFMEYSKLAEIHKVRTDSIENIFRVFMVSMKMDSLRADSLSKALEKPYTEMVKIYSKQVAEKIKQNPTSFASIMAIQQLPPEDYIEVYLSLDQGLSKRYPDNDNIKKFHEMVIQTETMVKRSKTIAEGSMAPEIKLPTPDGKELALSSFKGKVVLIDFWASWCAPCRKEMPNVKRIYEKYKNKGFEILGVSLDQDKEAWINAIEKDKLTWPQISDLGFWQSEAVQIYVVQAIPFTVLVDRDGKIIAKNLRGEELENKIAEVLK